MGNQSLGKKISAVLSEKKKTLALAESCTGGLISSLITDIPGSSSFYVGSIVSYSNKVKEQQLSVPKEMIRKHGAVSIQVAKAMAKGAREAMDSDFAASITGIAGPTGGTKQKPVGLAFIGFADAKTVRSKKIQFKGSRVEIKAQFAEAVLKFILENV